MEVPVQLRHRYFERRQHDLAECLRSLEQGEYPVIEKVGHQLKGNAASYGYPELSEIGKKMEHEALMQDRQQLYNTLGEFADWIEKRLN